ncbi:hypothetical protein VTK56DRAFT_3002 [Thermocarpiscus australiensis]
MGALHYDISRSRAINAGRGLDSARKAVEWMHGCVLQLHASHHQDAKKKSSSWEFCRLGDQQSEEDWPFFYFGGRCPEVRLTLLRSLISSTWLQNCILRRKLSKSGRSPAISPSGNWCDHPMHARGDTTVRRGKATFPNNLVQTVETEICKPCLHLKHQELPTYSA